MIYLPFPYFSPYHFPLFLRFFLSLSPSEGREGTKRREREGWNEKEGTRRKEKRKRLRGREGAKKGK